MEPWNIGMLGFKKKVVNFLQAHNSGIPLFHHSAFSEL